MKRLSAPFGLVLLLPLLAVATPSAAPQPSAAAKALGEIVGEYQAHRLAGDAAARIQQGLEVARLPDFSYEAGEKEAAFDRALRERLARVDARGLSHEEWLTLESGTQIGTETLRYSADVPGPALAYKMGSTRIWELRRKAEKELGKKFDLRRFHDAVIGSGPMPLTVLEKHVEWWIGEEKKR